MTQEYPWYEVVPETEEFEQGDFIDDCEIFIPSYASHKVVTIIDPEMQELYAQGIIRTYDTVIVSQSCTLENGRADDYVILCPRRPYSEYVDEYLAKGQGVKTREQIMKAINANLEAIRLSRSYQYCLLNESRLDVTCELQIVDFGVMFSIPYNVIRHIAKSSGPRLRLLSPYKEHLAHSFGHYYTRVALPKSIESFTKPKEKQVSTAPAFQRHPF